MAWAMRTPVFSDSLGRKLGAEMGWMGLVLSLAAVSEQADSPREPVEEGVGFRVLRASPETESSLRLSTVSRAQLRLIEVEAELRELLVRPSVGQVFLGNLKKVGPWMGLGLIPLSGGLVLGLGGSNYSLTIPMSAAQAVVYPVVGIGGFAVAGLLVALFSVVSHYIDEADRAPARRARIDALRLERDDLYRLVR